MPRISASAPAALGAKPPVAPPVMKRTGDEGVSRGSVVECGMCGYVFVLASRQMVCRRCKSESVEKWKGGRP